MKHSVYMTWAKHHAGARYNLANSGILGCDLTDLPLSVDDIMLNGPNHEGYLPLTKAIAAHYGSTPESIVTALGTSMANYLAMATVIERGDEVLIEEPTYEPLLAAAEYLGATIKRFGRRFEDGYQVNVDELTKLITAKTRLIVITSPHNPSAVAVDPETIGAIGRLAAKHGLYVMIDEAYRDVLLPDAPKVAATRGPQFITTNSLTKSHGLSGLRCGWVICDPALAERMRRLNDLFGAVGPIPSDSLGVVAFTHIEKLNQRTRSILDPNLKLIHAFLEEHSDFLECVIPARSMMVFPKLKRERDSEPLHDRLRQSDTSIVPGRFFERPAHFRVGFAVRTEDVARGLENLSAALKHS